MSLRTTGWKLISFANKSTDGDRKRKFKFKKKIVLLINPHFSP